MTNFRISDGYYVVGKHTRIHRLVWETQKGKIPKGYDIHHIDGNKLNNHIDNLQCLPHTEHLSMHMKENKTLHDWHKTDEGRKFLGEKSKKLWETREIYKLKCEQCGNPFEAKQIDRARYCDNKCEQAARRARGDDLIERQCVICSKTFLINKYYKTITCGYSCGSKWRTRFAKGKRH
jgi:hypothetical protein